MDVYKIIGNNIKRRRLELNLSQKQVADKIDIDYSYFGRMERGDQPISLKRLFQIAEVLDASVESLVRVPDDPKTASKRISVMMKGKPHNRVRLLEEIARIILKD